MNSTAKEEQGTVVSLPNVKISAVEKAGEIRFEDLMRGEYLKLVNDGFKEVFENVADPNFKTTAKRKLTIEITIIPSKHGHDADIVPSVKVGLPKKAVPTTSVRIQSFAGKVRVSEDLGYSEGQLDSPVASKP